MKSRALAGLIPLLTLILAGLSGRWLMFETWRTMRSRQPALNLQELGSALGQGVTIGILGGFRAIAADFLWLAGNSAWEQHDLPESNALIRVVTTVDPRPLYFWINGARIIAYDMPVWRIDEAGGHQAVPASVQKRLESEQAQLALEYLEAGLRYHPENPFLVLEVANIHLRRLGDVEAAAGFYRRAALRPGAPYYAGRIYAELLKRLGRPREALDWLREVHPRLPPNDPMAASEDVLGRIRALEERLGVPENERYAPGGSDDGRL